MSEKRVERNHEREARLVIAGAFTPVVAMAYVSYMNIGTIDFINGPRKHTIKELLENAQPITATTQIISIARNGDSIVTQQVDTVAWQVAADKLRFE